jgi:flagellar basal-body rod modification protein FlgD
MQTTAIDTSTVAPRPVRDRGLESLKSEDFFRILTSELAQQDPLEPAKTSEMISNVSQIRSIEVSARLADALERIARQQTMAGLSEFLGKFVSASVRGEDGTEAVVEGIVTGVRINPDGAAVLELDSGQSVAITDVKRVTTPEGAAQAAGAAAEGAATTSKSSAAKPASGGLLPGWLSLRGSFNL